MIANRTLTLARVAAAAAIVYHTAVAEAHQVDGATNSAAVARLSSSRPADATVRLQNQTTTVTLTGDDLPADILPNVRPSRLQVFEDGIRQSDVRVRVEHLPISLAVLLEMGGRSYELNHILQSEAPHLLRPLVDRLGEADSVSVFTYDDVLRPRLEFGVPREQWISTLGRFEAPRFSEANLHDATIQLLERMQSLAGRRALVLVTTGIDTFSRATFDDLLMRARAARTPIYCLSLADLARNRVIDASTGPLARVDWEQLEARCTQLAEASGGRIYRGVRAFNAPAMFDDMLERLRLRYVLSYDSAAARTSAGPREIEVRAAANDSARGVRSASGAPPRQRDHVIARIPYPPNGVVQAPSSPHAGGHRQGSAPHAHQR
jgi:Ca-activated chloride channel homolog